MRNRRYGFIMLSGMILLAGLALLWGFTTQPARCGEREVLILDLEGPISPASASFLTRGLSEAEERDAALVVVRLDTPGGLGSSMRTMVKAILNSPVPVVVYVAPRGAGAASAGVLVTISAHVAAMAPGTNIGAAHPVSAGGKDIEKTMSEKVVNDMASYARGIAKDKGRNSEWVEKAIRESVSITADEAVKKGVVDLVAENLDELLRLIDGREVLVKGQKITLQTGDLVKTYYRTGWRDRVLRTISDPNIAYLLMMIGMAGLFMEIYYPGAIFPGVIGAISLILAFYSFQTLPVNYAGVLLILLAVVLFIAEIKVTSYGFLSLGGLSSLVLGSIMLFDDVKVSLTYLIPTVALIGGFFVLASTLAFRAQFSKPKSGKEGLIGEVGIVKKRIDPEGLVFVHGEYWRAASRDPIESGKKVIVEGMEGLVLEVKEIGEENFSRGPSKSGRS